MEHNNVFKALSDPNRLRILDILCRDHCACTVTGIHKKCNDVDYSVISRHLKILNDAKIISHEKRGNEKYYTTNRKEAADFLRNVADRIENSSCCK